MKKMLFCAAVAALCLSSCEKQQWESLFNGKDLTGWEEVTGQAEFTVEDGCIVGICAPSDRNSFLATTKPYGDFILEFAFKKDMDINSGVQFRSYVDETDGKVHGYQFELDSSERHYDGAIYEECGRGWLYPLSYNMKARGVANYDEWNHCRIEAVGNRICTYINGVQCADLIDETLTDGFIALQIHVEEEERYMGLKTWWKDIRICTKDVEKYAFQNEEKIEQVYTVPNSLSEEMKADGWKLLWDGKTTEGWRSAKSDSFPAEGWSIKDGNLVVTQNDGQESANGGDIITVDEYENFILKVTFRLTKGANSGIKYFVQPDLNKGAGSAIGCEFQILDNQYHPDAQLGKNGNRTLGSLYDLITSDMTDTYIMKYSYNTAMIKVEGDHVEHWINGMKIVEYDRNCDAFNALVADSKYKIWPGFGNFRKGHILLQEHGDEVWFNSIMIKEL